MSIKATVAAIAIGRIDPVDLVEQALDRIARHDALLASFIHVDADGARATAHAARAACSAGSRLGALHGVPVALKDVFDVAGLRTTANSRLLIGDPPATQDSAVAARLRAAGAVILGKLHCWELSVGGPSAEPPFGPARNPWNPDREPGGSSSGPAAAVAASLVMAAIGGDTGGSIRLPAAHCGVVGFKPSHGIVPMDGAVPFAASLDVAGPLTRSVSDAASVHAVLAAQDLPRPLHTLRGRRIGVPRSLLALNPPSPRMAAALDTALARFESAGAIVRDVDLPSPALFNACYFIVARSEAFACWRDALRDHAGEVGAVARRSIAIGAFIAAADLVDAQLLRRELTSGFDGVLADIDALCLPTTPGEAAEIAPRDAVTRPDTAPYTRPFSLVGAPAISMPCGLGAGGLPLGLQLVGRRGGDGDLLSLAAAIEQMPSWEGRDLAPEPGAWN
jgi:aspartyl-tRNA(Asn)/glutamyl-tRNA(Gln) amidotransferase subunit A